MRLLEDFYCPQNISSAGQPIQVKVQGNTIYIDARFRYNKAAIKPWIIDGMSQADLIEAGIIRKWSGEYKLRSRRFKGYIKARVVINIRRDLIPARSRNVLPLALITQRQRSVLIKIRSLTFMPAHVISPWYRRIWGVLKTGQWESLGTNWSRNNPGIMVMPHCPPKSIAWFERMAAHEAGHLLGLGDAYGAIYRYYYAAPGTSEYMMHSNRHVQAREITMLLEAHMIGKMQFFPKKWDKKIFIDGFKREVNQKTRELERRKLQKKYQAKTGNSNKTTNTNKNNTRNCSSKQ